MFEKNGVVEKVISDESPFTEVESYSADAKFYIKKKVTVEDVEKGNVNASSHPKWKSKQVMERDHQTKEFISHSQGLMR